ncbi:hypothetical protein NHF50_02200 [Flavobacterium sp. NRK F10]|uniref:DUF4142 domain-containing protein n=1 Tax=Flavobacterium sediminis TaxID=2201181 RepID=A0A2U8QRK5_9FLAO|nr:MULTISPECIES: hypothetical protein [Flavobacterium]AWM12731.1 hypothetical protein DI487_01820 [Flavobacterium sediminis]MCO6173851.1 hypothetical protein [Flavobacterium sp. NRK F10]
MKIKRIIPKLLFLLAVTTGVLVSCKREEKNMDNPIIHMINEDIHNKVDSQFLNDITVSGLKILNVTQYAKEQELSLATQNIVSGIEAKHLNLNKRIKKIAKKNLIILPDTIQETEGITEQNETETRDYVYLVALEKLIKEEVEEFTMVKKNTQNEELKQLAENAIGELNSKLNLINSELN